MGAHTIFFGTYCSVIEVLLTEACFSGEVGEEFAYTRGRDILPVHVASVFRHSIRQGCNKPRISRSNRHFNGPV